MQKKKVFASSTPGLWYRFGVKKTSTSWKRSLAAHFLIPIILKGKFDHFIYVFMISLLLYAV